MQLVDKEVRRQVFLNEHYIEWLDNGEKFRKRREKLGLSLREVSGGTGTSQTTIRNFEVGNPIQRAQLIEKAYDLFLTLQEMKVKKPVLTLIKK
jgi:transcriptional regulator with XRE-family HTH domain